MFNEKTKNYIKLLRPAHLLKNLFIFLPLFFGLKIFNLELVGITTLAFVAFSLIAGSVYILNDYFDIEEDRQHPRKKTRPLVSGAVSKPEAIFLMVLLFLIGILISVFLNIKVFYIIIGYLLLNILYTLKIKHIPILDVSSVAAGFIMRLFVGSVVSGVELTMWILIMTFLLALFLALAKRREDILLYLENGIKTRQVVDGYNPEFLNASMIIMASTLIVSYILYTVSPEVIAKTHSNVLYMTALFVILGILRYMQITLVENKSGSPTEVLLKDRFIQSCIFFWVLSFVFILYL